MKTWKIPVSYRMVATINVEANTLNEAIEIAKDRDGVIPIPDNGEYLDSSWAVDYLDDKEYIRCWFNHNQEDGKENDENDENNTKEKTYQYEMKVRFCDGYYCDGSIDVEAESEQDAIDIVLEDVCERLNKSLPDLGVDVTVECVWTDEDQYDEDDEEEI